MTDDQIRALLDEAVADVEPRHGLDGIRSRTTARRSRRRWVWSAGGAVLATAATIAVVAVLLNGGPGPTDADPGFADRSTNPSQPKPTTATDRPDDTAQEATVPVYLVGDTAHGPRLFREFHRSTADDPDRDAVQMALAGTAADGDYHSLWPQGTNVGGVAHEKGTITVDLTTDGDLADRPTGMTETEARMSIQQLVYTAQAVYQDGRPPVRFQVDGSSTGTLLGVPVSEPVVQGSADQVLAQVWVTTPTDGATVASPFTVEGQAAAFEANVQWELMQGSTVVKRGFTTAEECCTLAPYSFTVTAPPGDYTLVVHDEDASGGEGLPPWQDTKEITVE